MSVYDNVNTIVDVVTRITWRSVFVAARITKVWTTVPTAGPVYRLGEKKEKKTRNLFILGVQTWRNQDCCDQHFRNTLASPGATSAAGSRVKETMCSEKKRQKQRERPI